MSDRDELFETMGRVEGEGAARREQLAFVVSALRGEATAFGRPVKLVFTDPQPGDKTEAEIADIYDPARTVKREEKV